MGALAIGSLPYAFKSLIQGAERLPGTRRLEGKGLPFVLGCCLISFICMSCRTCLLLLLRVDENTRGLLNAGLQNSLKALELVSRSQADEVVESLILSVLTTVRPTQFFVRL